MAADSLAADLAAAVAAVFKRLPMRIANAFFAYLKSEDASFLVARDLVFRS